MRVPSGEKAPNPSNSLPPVSGRAEPVATSTSWSALVSASPPYGVSRRVMTMVLPSGDQESGCAGGPGQGHDEDLRLLILARAGRGQQREPVAGGRPARMVDAAPLVGERALDPRGHVDQHEVRLPAVLVVVGPGHHDHDRLAVGRDL